MQTLLLIAIGSAIVNNVVLSQFLGICPFWNGWSRYLCHNDILLCYLIDL